MSSSKREILAFCHIEKAAGTSLIHVLRQLFGTGYLDVRPISRGQHSFFNRADFELLDSFVPRIGCIGGHSVVPHSDLLDADANFRYLTLFRDPKSRVLSHYRFWVQRMGSNFGPEEFLQHPVASNFQVRKIAGSNDLEKAKEVIRDRFLLVGTIEEFDEFLVLLNGILKAPFNKILYRSKNIASDNKALQLPQGFHERVEELNDLDRELYDWVRNELIPEYIKQHGAGFAEDLKEFKGLLNDPDTQPTKAIPSLIMRRAYVRPVTGLIRRWNGMPYSGSYAD